MSRDTENLQRLAAELPVIDTARKHLPMLTQQAFDALVKANDPPRFFQRGGVLVELDRDGTHLKFREITIDRLTGIMARVADWRKISENGYSHVFPLPQVMRDMLALSDPPPPRINFISTVPILTSTGEILSEHGYHANHSAYLDLAMKIPFLPSTPSLTEVERAKGLLLELVEDFPFESDADRAHALAALLLPFVRPAIKGPTPLHVFDAPTAGNGKTLLAEVSQIPAHGDAFKIDTLPHDEEELRKKITSYLVEGRGVIALDNVKGVVDSGKLAAALTSGTWTDRLLGSTRMVEAPNTAVWIMTGNNIRMSGEITRRTIRSRLDALVEHPEDRAGFRHPRLKAWALERRGDLIHAALTLVRHWQAQGCPKPQKTLGSFEAWSEIVGGILEAAEIPGFLGDRKKLREELDSENSILRSFVSAWFEQFGRRAVKTSDLYPLAKEIDGFPLGGGNEQGQKNALGKKLREIRNRIIAGNQIAVSGAGHGGALLYFLADPETRPPFPPSPPEQDRATRFDGGQHGGHVVGTDLCPPNSTTCPPRPTGSGSSFGDDGGQGGHETQPADIFFEEVD